MRPDETFLGHVLHGAFGRHNDFTDRLGGWLFITMCGALVWLVVYGVLYVPGLAPVLLIIVGVMFAPPAILHLIRRR